MALAPFQPKPPALLVSLLGEPGQPTGAGFPEPSLSREEPPEEVTELTFDEVETEEALDELDDTFQFEKPSEPAPTAESAALTPPAESTPEPEGVDLFPEGEEDLAVDLDDFAFEEPELSESPAPQPSTDKIVLETEPSTPGPSLADEPPTLDLSELEEETPLVDLEASEDEPLELDDLVTSEDEGVEEFDLSAEGEAGEETPGLEGAFLPHGDTIALEREFLGLDLELEESAEPIESGAIMPETATEDTVILEPDLLSEDEITAAPSEPQLSTAKQETSALGDDMEVNLEEEILEEAEEPIELKDLASAVEEGIDEVDLSVETPAKPSSAPPLDTLSPDDTLSLDLESLGLDLELEEPEEKPT